MAGTASHGLECGNTILLTRTSGKADAIGTFQGLGVLKISADGKTATQWWFDTGDGHRARDDGPGDRERLHARGVEQARVRARRRDEEGRLNKMGDGAEFMTETQTKVK